MVLDIELHGSEGKEAWITSRVDDVRKQAGK
jgi:hypothetical protein